MTTSNGNIIREVYRLYDMDLNVLPQPYGRKEGFPWRGMQFNRLSHRFLPHVFEGLCNVAVMVGRTSRNLFVIDAETETSFSYHVAMFRQRKIPVWAVKTARGGHLWAFCADGMVKSDSLSGEDYEIRGDNGYVLCPPSLHPSGMTYEWLYQEGKEPPIVSISQLDWLPIKQVSRPKRTATATETLAQEVGMHLGLSNDWRIHRLSTSTLRFLENPTYDDSNNDLLFKAACDLHACGFTEQEAITFLGLSEKKMLQTIRSAYSKSRVSLRPESKKVNPAMKWKYLDTYLRTFPWNHRTSQTDLLVALALLERAKVDANQKGIFRASYRELQSTAMIGHRKTMEKALNRLLNYNPPLLFRAGNDKRTGASLWRFSDIAIDKGRELFHQSEPLLLIQRGISSGSLLYGVDEHSSNASERGALGHIGMRVYLTLCRLRAGVKVKWLAEITGLKEHQIRYKLRLLYQCGLVKRPKHGYWKAVELEAIQDLDIWVALPRGKFGAGEKRAEKLAEERRIRASLIILNWRLKRDAVNLHPHLQENNSLSEII